LADLGILCASLATTTIYPTNSTAECAYILSDSGSIGCFVENEEQLGKIQEVWGDLPDLAWVVVIEGASGEDDRVLTLEELERRGAAWSKEHPGEYKERMAAVGSEDLATLIYTSGTTGKPKGVMLTHDNWVFEGEALDKVSVLQASDKQFLFLPLAHSFAKVMEIAFIRLGVPTVVDGDPDSLLENLQATQPTVLGGVPRLFEKVYDAVQAGAKETGGAKYRIFQWALEVGGAVSALRQKGQEPRGTLAIQHKLADKLVYSKLKDRFGGHIRYFVSGGAPLAPEIASFFHAADILVLEGYGLTESSAASVVNSPDHFKFGTVGRPLPGMEVEIAEDGEILMKGRGVMQGYYNREKDTAKALVDGWLHTGDIGVLDEEGFLRITDRKKDIIVTSGGKNIAPQNIENQLKVNSSLISQAVMHGDKRPYCVALVTLNAENTQKWARERGFSFSDMQELAGLEKVQARVWSDIQAVNDTLASYETIKKIHILPAELSQESGELTPTLKVKRRVVEKRFKKILDSLYE